MRHNFLIRRGCALVGGFLATGTALGDVVTWTGNCGTRAWETCCVTNTPDGSVFHNNWDRPESDTGCPPLPGMTDDVLLPAGADVVLSISGQIQSITTDAGSSLDLSGGSIFTSNASTIEGNLIWRNAQIGGAGEWTVESPLQILGPGTRSLFDKTLRIDDAFVWLADTGSSLQLNNNSRLVNAGFVALLTDAIIVGSNGTFRNEGDMLLLGSGLSRIESRIENIGSVEIATGTLQVFGQGMQWGGATYVRSGAELRILGGVATIMDNAAFSGPGSVELNSVSLTLAGSAAFENVEFLSGEMTGGNPVINGTLSWTNGTMRGAGVTTIGPSGTVDTANSGSRFIDQRRFVNNGLMTLHGTSPLNLQGTAVLENNGVINIDSIGTPIISSSQPQNAALVNHGSIVRVNQSGTSMLSSAVTNEGEIRADAGTLALTRGGTNEGALSAAANAELQLTGGNWTFPEGARIGGPGITRLQTEVTLNGAVEFDRVAFPSGSISGIGALRIVGQFDWTSGIIRNTTQSIPDIIVTESGRVVLGGSTSQLQRRRLVNNGTLSFATQGGMNLINGATIDNRGLMEFTANSFSMFASAPDNALQNSGTIRAIRVGGQSINADINVVSTNTGSIVGVASGDGVSVNLNFRRGLTQDAGEISLNHSMMIVSPLIMNGGTLTGDGTVRGEFTQYGGIVKPGLEIGTLTITSRYVQNAGRLQIQVAGTAANQHDVLTAINAELHGVLEVLFEEDYQPQVGDSFTVLECPQGITGQFSAVEGPANAALRVEYVTQQQTPHVVVTIDRLIGDVNCDGAVNNFDIDAFILALSDPDAFGNAYPDCNIDSADANRDGAINNFDIDAFVALLG